MNNKQSIIVGMVIMAMSAFAAAPQVKNVKAMQQYPWGKVYISYEVEGDIAASAGSGPTPELFLTAKDKATGKLYVEVGAGSSWLTGDVGTASGLHHVVWDIGAQGMAINSANVVFTVAYRNGMYLVIDLSGGANASTYPMSYLDAVPSGGWTDEYKTTKLVLRRLPAGTFKMQNSSDVTLTKPFYMGVFEVTQRQYELVTGTNPCSSSLYGKGNTYPVHYVSYNTIRGSSNGAKWPSSSAVDSSSFMGKLRARTGLDFDLPTEAQWEYACRSETTTTYYWGNSMNGNYAWYTDNSGDKTHPVGGKTPNAWGLYDMSGNVWEWCLDWYDTLSYGTDPKGSSSGVSRVKRGGSWYDVANFCTSSRRNYDNPSGEYNSRGFRLVRTL